MLYVWEVAMKKSLIGSTVHAGEISALAFGAHGKLVATAGKSDEQVRVWDVASGKEVRQIRGFTTPATVLAFSADGTKVLASNGATVQVFSVATGEQLDDRMPMGGSVKMATFTSDGQIVAIAEGSEKSTVLAWRPEKDSKVARFEFVGDLTALAVTPDGRSALIGKNNGEVELWNLAKGRLVWGFAGLGHHPVRALSVAPDGRSYTVIGASPDGSMVIQTESDELRDSGLPPPKK
jgi:WD40 repeat protein